MPFDFAQDKQRTASGPRFQPLGLPRPASGPEGVRSAEFSQLNSPLTLLITNYICDNK